MENADCGKSLKIFAMQRSGAMRELRGSQLTRDSQLNKAATDKEFVHLFSRRNADSIAGRNREIVFGA
jgi:hypothetical protein